MGRSMKLLGFTCLVLAVSAVFAMSASARNSGNKAQLTLTCEGETHEVTIAGNGDWSPARDNGTTTVFHPSAFGQVTRTFYPADGSAPQTTTEPAHEWKTQPQNGHKRVDCTFYFENTYPNGTQIDTGSVSGWLS